jgi:TRAP-type C4-dicarboxylate transport system permease large subunit
MTWFAVFVVLLLVASCVISLLSRHLARTPVLVPIQARERTVRRRVRRD